MRAAFSRVDDDENTSENRYDYTNVIKVLSILYNESKGFVIGRLLLQILLAVLPFVPLYLLKLLLDSFAMPVKPEAEYIIFLLICFAAARIVLIILSNVNQYLSLLHSDLIVDHMSNLLISQALKVDLEHYDSAKYHDVMKRALQQGGIRPLAIFNSLTMMVQNIISMIAVIVILWTLHWSIIFILIFVAIPFSILKWKYSEKNVNLGKSQTQKDRKSFYYKLILTSKEYAQEVRIFGFGNSIKEYFLEIRKIIRKEKRQLYLKQSKAFVATQSFEIVALILIIGFIVKRALDGFISVGDIALYYRTFQKGQGAINTLIKSVVSMNENRIYSNYLFEFLNIESTIKEPENPIDLPASINQLGCTNLSFAYPGTNKNVLKDISLSFKKGELVAIVGENGSGKSTLIRLLSRLYNPSEGTINVNEHNIEEFHSSDYRANVSVIFQLFSKYNANILENVNFKANHNEEEISKIKESLDESSALAFVDELPQRFRTQLGRAFKLGNELSGGQWQKIAIARVFNKDAEILIMDEPTSFIDPLSEDKIFDTIHKKSKDAILILVTHRLYNLKKADKIIVLDNGEVAEQGNFENLMAQKGLFYQMFAKQSTQP